jgi:glyoxylase-like metal-dependent hydrolase (beta-lactamase superfamily II)
MGTEYYVDWQDRTYAPRPASALPTETFYSHDPQPIELERGLEKIEYGHLREAHTDGDIFVWLREHNVLAVGGVVSVGEYPILDYATGGWIGGLMDATAKLLALADKDTLIVPGRGPAQRRDFLVKQQEMIATVRGRVEDLMRKGKSANEMIAADVTREFDSSFGTNREQFVENVYGGLWWQGRLTGSL